MASAGHFLERARNGAPVIHNITNLVAVNFMANVLLAVGALPVMAHAREEVAEISAGASALTVNIGTPCPERGAAMEDAALVMQRAGKPWVLDPVGVGASHFRKTLAERLILLKPPLIRGNASEILALVGSSRHSPRLEAAEGVALAMAPAAELARMTGGVVAVTGPVDFVTDGTRGCHVANGHALMAQVTAMGCALNGVIAAFCVGAPKFEATVAALSFYGLAGENAARSARGPGSFQPAFLDALAALKPAELDAGARVSVS